MLTASFTPVEAADYIGFIHLRGYLKGETSITITDNVTHDTQTLNAKVTDTYLACPIAWSEHPAIATGLVLYFVNNAERACYFFSKDHFTHTLSSQPMAQGTYYFSIECENLALNIIKGYLNVDWGSMIEATSTGTPPPFSTELELKEIGTGYVIETANLDSEPQIPEGIL